MSKITVLSPFTIDPDAHSDAHGHYNDSPSLTVQADAESADINYIVKQFGVTGTVPYGSFQPFYDDVTTMPADYQQALQFISDTDAQFASFPSDVRDRFNNSPQMFLRFISDDDNYAEAVSLGFIEPRESVAAAAATDSGGQQA